jgi:hypothetical protein
VPESRHKYLYERLGDHDFQQLVSALLALQFPDYVPLPLRQSDGGRDGVVGPDRLVFQVKWSARGRERDPVSWLDAEVRGEAEKIKRLAAQGARKYVLVTNVESTGKPKSGTFDRLDAKLQQYSSEFGLEMSCLWREALNSIVDSAPTETKWAYAEMLAGWDLIRYLVSEQGVAARDSELRDIVRKVASAQWDEDERIKFSQVELDRERLTDLFVDVPAESIRVPKRVLTSNTEPTPVGGAASYVATKTPYPFTLIRGAPGQGKSTLSQFVCQAYRIAFVPDQSSIATGLPEIRQPRFPLRLDLGDYAAWMQGYDVFDKTDDARLTKGPKRKAAHASIESFLAELIGHGSGRGSVTSAEVQEIFDRVPSLVVLDGLDEVGNLGDRKRVVHEIDMFCARGKSYAVEPKVIVTTRPNSAGLPEPNNEIFEVVSLSPLDASLRDEYLRKWCVVHNVRGNDSRVLRRNFTEKTKEPYIGELAGNPMQLTILLYLLRQHGDATPNQRTELYDAYMALLLAREANKRPESVRKYRDDLTEIVPFLGWYLQSRGEEQGHSGRMAFAEVDAAMKHFQTTYGKPTEVVDELFLAASDRLWALTSKEEGTFEFEVLSLREYFAARFLYFNAGEGDQSFDRTEVFRELLRRPYWLNTARFYSGNARGSDLYVLKAGIEHELQENTSKQVRVASWSLLTDGVFNSRPNEAASVVNALTDQRGSRLLLAALDSKAISPLPESSHAKEAWTRLTTDIRVNPADPQNSWRVRVIRDLLGLRSEFTAWWLDRLTEAIESGQDLPWLAIGAEYEVLAGLKADVPGLSAENGLRAQLILNCGIVPEDGGMLEAQLIRAVLDGQCSETTSTRSRPAQIAVALSPGEYYAFGADAAAYRPVASSNDRRALAMQNLRKTSPEYATIARLRRFRRGEKGSTFPWANTATALLNQTGRCWLVSEIAVIGAAAPSGLGVTKAPGTAGLGSAGHPATLITETRSKADDVDWWRDRLGDCQDDLSRAEWALALWAKASGGVIQALAADLETVIEQLPASQKRAFETAARRLSESGWIGYLWPIPVQLTGLLEELAGLRSGQVIEGKAAAPYYEAPVAAKPLAEVARKRKWLKVDRTPSYR